MKDKKKRIPLKIEITPQGSLGVLALGANGVKAWRKVKKKADDPQEK